MFAVITELADESGDKKIVAQRIGCLLHLMVGKRVGRRSLTKVLQNFSGKYIFSKSVNRRGIVPFPTEHFKKDILFAQFCDRVLNSKGAGLFVGIIDRDGSLLESDDLTRIITHTESVIICTLKTDIDNLCKNWIYETGICPEITSDPKYLTDCDCVFSPDLRVAVSGVLFGQGGLSIDRTKINLPKEYQPLTDAGVDPVDLACILNLTRATENLNYRINS